MVRGMQMVKAAIQAIRKHKKGSAMLEFALGMPMLMLFLFGTADVGRLFYYSIEVANAAGAGAAYGSLNPGNMTDTTGISNARGVNVVPGQQKASGRSSIEVAPVAF